MHFVEARHMQKKENMILHPIQLWIGCSKKTVNDLISDKNADYIDLSMTFLVFRPHFLNSGTINSCLPMSAKDSGWSQDVPIEHPSNLKCLREVWHVHQVIKRLKAAVTTFFFLKDIGEWSCFEEFIERAAMKEIQHHTLCLYPSAF